jgi:predicted oxidoreductase
MALDADVVVVGAGLAGLVATAELADAGRRVILVDQEPEASLGGQAFWSFGGLFFVDSPEQRRMRIRDSRDLALQDWLGTAGFDRPEDHWPRRWAEAYVDFAAGEKRAWLHGQGLRIFPVVGWAERGGFLATGPGNSVPRFHITWGTGPGVVEPFERRVRAAVARGLVELRFRHRVTGLTTTGGAVDGVTGEVLVESDAARGTASSREVVGDFALRAQAVVVTSGGIGGNHDLVRAAWPERLGTPPKKLLSGVPAHVDGLMLGIAGAAGGSLVNGDRMWHYTEGIENWDPIWARHGIRILPGPSSLWLDATGKRLPVPYFPGFDTLGTLEHIMGTGHEYTWFVLTQKIIEKEFALSGSEQNPDLTGRSVRQVLKRALPGAPGPVEAFKRNGADFVVERELGALVRGMNALTGEELVQEDALRREIEARDREIANAYTKDLQVTAIRGARNYIGDKLVRTASPHRLLDPKAGPLIAVRLNILTRKSLGGLETDLDGRVLAPPPADGRGSGEGGRGEPLGGLYAAGEAAGFGGGGVHGYRSLEGTFLGGCIFSGRAAGRAAAAATA